MNLLLALLFTLMPVSLGIEREQPRTPGSTVKEAARAEPRTPEWARRVTHEMAASRGMNDREIRCLKAIWTAESNFRPNAYNKQGVRTATGIKHAGGVPQVLGLNPNTPVRHQVKIGLRYVEHRYGTACAALRWWLAHRWY